MFKCLIDADVIAYEISSCGEYKDENGELQIREWDFVRELVDQRINLIEEACFATEPSTLFFTADEALIKMWNKFHEDKLTYKENYRVRVAKAKPYKGTRRPEKPFHFHNVRAYLLSAYDCQLAVGCEADDLICIWLTSDEHYIACSRDKDLRQVAGWHYSWPCGKQEEWGPKKVEGVGELYLDGNKVRGTGPKFFYYQLLVGDSVDNIPGLPGCGPKKAYEALSQWNDESELRSCAYLLYAQKGLIDDYLQEQHDLLYILRKEEELEKWVGQVETSPAVTEHGQKQSLETS